jgi:aminoglycoside phosphotransferase
MREWLPLDTFPGETAVARKYKGNLNGQRYVANMSPYKREVHDLDNENRNCLIDEIIRSGQDKPYSSLSDARQDDYSVCAFCSGNADR